MSSLTIEYPYPLSGVYYTFKAQYDAPWYGNRADINAHRLLEWIAVEGREQLLAALDQLDSVVEHVVHHEDEEYPDDGHLGWDRKEDYLEWLEKFGTEMLRALVVTAGTWAYDPAWVAFNNRTVELLAKSIRRTREHGNAPILADALEEAGCANPELLQRCRNAKPDARSNWVVDLLVAGADGMYQRPVVPTPER